MSNFEVYTEFTSKKGQDIVVCNLIDQVRNPGVKEYIACPICSRPELLIGYDEHRRRKLQTDGYIGYCFRCNRTFLNPHESDSDYTELSKFDVSTKLHRYDVDALSTDLFDSFDELGVDGLRYLQSRDPIFSDKFCKSMNIKSVQNGVVIPFYLDNNLVYYVIRFIKSIGGRRYHMPPTHNKPLFIPSLISKTKFIIVEGVFDAFACMLLYPEYTPCAVLGSKITFNQVKYLSERYSPESILVYLDDSSKSTKTKEFIKSTWKGLFDIEIVDSDGTDPEEYLNKLLNETII